MFRAPSTTSLLCLEASARLGSFTAAGEELHLSQGAVSRQIQTLELRLDVQLFTRRRDSLELTDAGRYYLDEITPLLQRLERATANVMAFKWRGGDLSLSVGASVGAYWLIPRLPAFTQAHGEITLSLSTRVGPTDFKTAIDASLEFGDGQRSGMHSDFVLALDLAPYAAPAWIATHGKRVSDATPRASLLHHHTLPDGWDHWFRFDGLTGNPGRDGPRFEIMSMSLNAAVAGLGVVLLPTYMVADHLAAGRLKRLSRRQLRYPKGYYLVYPPAAAARPALRTFRQWLLQTADVAAQAQDAESASHEKGAGP